MSVLLATLVSVLSAPVCAAEPTATRGLDALQAEVGPEGAGIGITRYRALLFSAQDYGASSGIPDLGSPDRDVSEIGRVLRERYGFEVEVVTQATEAAIISRLDALKASSGDGDAVLVYFAGHGMYDEAEARGYWLPVDAEVGQTSRWVSNDDVAAKLRAIPARHVLLVVDSCFSGMFRDVPRPTAAVPDLAPLRALAGKRSRVVVTSGGNEPVSDRGRDGMSVFAYFLREALEAVPGRYVVLDTLFPELRARVQQNAPQTPQQGVFQGAFHEGGQLVLQNQTAAEGTLVAARVDRAAAERRCNAAKAGDREAWEKIGTSRPADRWVAMTGASAKVRDRLLLHACVDHAMGLLSDEEYAEVSGVLEGKPEAQASMSKAALAQLRAESREVPPPARCDVGSPGEAGALVKAQALLRNGTSGGNRPEDREAKRLLEEAVRSSGRAPLWAALARARLYVGDAEREVSDAAARAAEACPGWGVPESYRGAALAAAGDLRGAEDALTEAVRRSPDFAFGHYNRGAVALGRGDVRTGLGALEKALELDPLLGEAHYLRGRVLVASGRAAEGVTALESAADLRPEQGHVWSALADGYEAVGKPDAAREARARSRSPR